MESKCPECQSTVIVDGICMKCGFNVAQWEAENPVCSGCGKRHPANAPRLDQILSGKTAMPEGLRQALAKLLGSDENPLTNPLTDEEHEAATILGRSLRAVDSALESYADDGPIDDLTSVVDAMFRTSTKLDGIASELTVDMWNALREAADDLASIDTILVAETPEMSRFLGQMAGMGRIAFVLGYHANKGEMVTA